LLHPHAQERAFERGATEAEIIATVTSGSRALAKHGRTLFTQEFGFDGNWRGRRYNMKCVYAYAVEQPEGWLVITVIVKFF
jgi:hypothetical protein